MKKTIIFLIVLSAIFMPFKSVFALERGKVIGDTVSVRAKASSSSSTQVLNKVIYGTYVTILGEEGNFYKVIYDGLNTGYMGKDYILKESEYKLDDPAYCESLKALGFPDTYCPYLSYIHKAHPSWSFTPIITNLDFYAQVVDGEEGKNCMASTNEAYIAGPTLCDKGGYYYVNQTVNAYFLDPRNFLHEKTIFMFENLGYVEREENKKAVTDIFGPNSFIVAKTDTDGSSYVDYFIGAGKTYNVSPIHLASRSKQEGASNEDYTPVSGTCTLTLEDYGNRTLYGFYNFYNIGATSGGSPTLKGLAYAAGYVGKTDLTTTYGRPWNTRKKAIFGGAEFLSASYIGKGQYNLYLQKFNTNPASTNSLYTHQYMDNIYAPYSEAKSIKDSLQKNGLLETSFNFAIPVYKNMPPETVQATLLSGNNLLSSINLDGQPLPGFDGDILEYQLYYLDTKTSVSVTAVSNSADATVTGVGDIALPNVDNKVVVTVTAQNGDKRTYTINIKRVKDTTTVEEVVQKLGVKNRDNYMYGLNVGTAVTTITQSVLKISPTATVKITDAAGNTKTTGNIVTGDKIYLKTLTSSEKKYDLAINGDVYPDGVIDIKDFLVIQKHLLGIQSVSGTVAIAADDNYDAVINIKDLLLVQRYILYGTAF